MRAYRNHILLKPVAGPETTRSGLYVPGGGTDTKNIGKVISLGLGVDRSPAALPPQVGDLVVYGSALKFLIEGEEYLVCTENEILLVL